MDEDIRNVLQDYEKRISKLERLFQSKPETVEKKLSLKEFILSKKPNDDVQKTLVIGYYLEKYDSMPSFNTKDLEDGFRAAKESVPDNINYKIIRNIEKGYMMEAKDKKDKLKAWNLTNLGEKFVEEELLKESE